MYPPATIDTPRLLLRKPALSDADGIFDEYASDPEVTRYLTWHPHEKRDVIGDFIQDRLRRWDTGEEYSWAITRRPESRVIGMISCRVQQYGADIGYVLGRRYWNQGIGTEAAKAVVDWAAELKGIYRVWAVCDVDNPGSARVLEKIGMVREGILRRWIIHPNISDNPRDCFVYAKVR